MYLKRFETQQLNQLLYAVEMHDMILFSIETSNKKQVGQGKDCKLRLENN